MSAQRMYCHQDHPGGDQEAENWCRMYHRPQLPACDYQQLGQIIARGHGIGVAARAHAAAVGLDYEEGDS